MQLIDTEGSPSSLDRDVESRGWTTYSISFPTDASQSVSIVASSSVCAWSGAAALLCLGVMLWLGKQRVGLCVWLCCGALLITLAAPTWLTPFTSALFVGSLFGCVAVVVSCVWSNGHSAETTLEPRSQLVQEPLRLGLVLLAIATLEAGLAFADDDETPQEAAKTEYRVFIPCDDQGKPTGGRYSVPEDFYNALVERAGSATELRRLGHYVRRIIAPCFPITSQGADWKSRN